MAASAARPCFLRLSDQLEAEIEQLPTVAQASKLAAARFFSVIPTFSGAQRLAMIRSRSSQPWSARTQCLAIAISTWTRRCMRMVGLRLGARSRKKAKRLLDGLGFGQVGQRPDRGRITPADDQGRGELVHLSAPRPNGYWLERPEVQLLEQIGAAQPRQPSFNLLHKPRREGRPRKGVAIRPTGRSGSPHDLLKIAR